MISWLQLRIDVERRAAGRCEYCLMHQSLQGATFHVEHIIPKFSGGSSAYENLAWACPGCNLRKSNLMEGLDPKNGTVAKLFNPRLDIWVDHFGWNQYEMVGFSPSGRATIQALGINDSRRLLIRSAEELFGLFPP